MGKKITPKPPLALTEVISKTEGLIKYSSEEIKRCKTAADKYYGQATLNFYESILYYLNLVDTSKN